MVLSRFCLKEEEEEEEGKNFRSLEVRRKLIALKNGLGHFKGQINILPDKKAKPVPSKELCIDMCTSGFSDLPPPHNGRNDD